ncbi:hypothetical protein OH492_13440 [Vibrio chagasii]|nr:hypothetical protein [Vibrio chagasii]
MLGTGGLSHQLDGERAGFIKPKSLIFTAAKKPIGQPRRAD